MWQRGSQVWDARGIAQMWTAAGGALTGGSGLGQSNWPLTSLPRGQTFAALQFVTARDGVAVALPPGPFVGLLVYRTTDGGRKWTQLPVIAT